MAMCHRLRRAHESRQIPNPHTKLVSADTLRVVGGIIEDTEDIFYKKVGNRESHAGESPHEEVGRVGEILIKRGVTIQDGVWPGIAVINPSKIRINEDPEDRKPREGCFAR
jgi:hypothetical protein